MNHEECSPAFQQVAEPNPSELNDTVQWDKSGATGRSPVFRPRIESDDR
jgi:hypothetical protein